VFVHRMVFEIDVFFLILFSIVSCLVEALHLVKGINNNSSILRTMQSTTTDFHQCAAEGLQDLVDIRRASLNAHDNYDNKNRACSSRL